MPRRIWLSLASAASALSILLAPLGARADVATPGTHVVQPGETLSQIALDAGVDTATLASLNGLDDPDVLRAGQTLQLPPGVSLPPASGGGPSGAGASAAPATAAAPPPAAAIPPAAATTYTVADGDTLWSIAHQFGTTTDVLAQLNSMDNADVLKAGAVLTLPAAATTATA